nr:MAG TPA: hypothetical protein [Bacteriophage sp.]
MLSIITLILYLVGKVIIILYYLSIYIGYLYSKVF